MKKALSYLFLIVVLYGIYFYRNDISNYIVHNYIYNKKIEIPDSNEYKRIYDFNLVQNTNDFYPKNKQELYNVFYSILNNGFDSFTFYCAKEYKDCSKDIRELTDPKNQTLSTINNYVHPFNSYSSININMNNFGRITVQVAKLYSNEDIIKINTEIDRIYKEIIKDNMTAYQKIKTVHDYIINNTVYDKEWTNSNDKTTKSNTAYGTLFNHTALCGGYTDTLELFLEKMGIKSYKIASENHVWNYVFINNEWRHFDVTFDDPVTNTGKNILQYDYYDLKTSSLEEKKDNDHSYNKNLYLEAN